MVGQSKTWIGDSSNLPIELLSSVSNIPIPNSDYSLDIIPLSYSLTAGDYYNISYEANFVIVGADNNEYEDIQFIGKTFAFTINGVIGYPGLTLSGIKTEYKTYITSNRIYFPYSIVVSADSKPSLFIFSKNNNSLPKYPGTLPSISGTFNMVGYTWKVIHDQYGIKYCILNSIPKYVQWDNVTTDYSTLSYNKSTIKKECDQFAKDTGIDQLDYVVDTGVGKVFIPTREQIKGEDGGFSYMIDDTNRSIGSSYWLSSFYYGTSPRYSFYIWSINSSGSLDSSATSPKLSKGFRPCIAIRY